MATRSFVTTGYAHGIVLCHEFGAVPEPMEIFPSLEAFDRAYPPADRDQYDTPVRVTMTYEVDVSDTDQADLDRILSELAVDDEDGALAALTGD